MSAPQLCLYQHCQYRRRSANISRDGDECFGDRKMMIRQPLDAITRQIQLINFGHNRFKSHGCLFL